MVKAVRMGTDDEPLNLHELRERLAGDVCRDGSYLARCAAEWSETSPEEVTETLERAAAMFLRDRGMQRKLDRIVAELQRVGEMYGMRKPMRK